MNLANGLSILFIFSKTQLLVLLIFAIVFFVSISFISALNFMISFHLLTLGFVCSCFFIFLIEVQLIYNVVLMSAVQERDSVIHIYTFFFLDSFPLWFIIGY